MKRIKRKKSSNLEGYRLLDINMLEMLMERVNKVLLTFTGNVTVDGTCQQGIVDIGVTVDGTCQQGIVDFGVT